MAIDQPERAADGRPLTGQFREQSDDAPEAPAPASPADLDLRTASQHLREHSRVPREYATELRGYATELRARSVNGSR